MNFSCQKSGNSNRTGLGAGIPDNNKTEFEICGVLHENCNLEPANFRQIKLYKGESLNLLSSAVTDENGAFCLTFEGELPPLVPLNAGYQISPPNILEIENDSSNFLLPGLTEFNNLSLILNDSIDINVNIVHTGEGLAEFDTLLYYFQPPYQWISEFGIIPHEHKISGPLFNDTLIIGQKFKWNFKEINPDGNQVQRIFWKFRKPNGETSSDQFNSLSTKESCISNPDSVRIDI